MSGGRAVANNRTRQQNLTKTLVLKDYRQRLRDNIKSLTDNFGEIVKLSKTTETDPNQQQKLVLLEHEQYETEVRVQNMSRAVDSLSKLVNDLKQFIVLHDFGFVDETVEASAQQAERLRQESESTLNQARELIYSDLTEIQEELNGGRY